MAWESRDDWRYMYRTFRVGGRVRERYLGKGCDAFAYQRQLHARHAQRQQHVQVRKWTVALRAQARQVRDLMAASLAAQGYYNRKGTWRRYRRYAALRPGEQRVYPTATAKLAEVEKRPPKLATYAGGRGPSRK